MLDGDGELRRRPPAPGAVPGRRRPRRRAQAPARRRPPPTRPAIRPTDRRGPRPGARGWARTRTSAPVARSASAATAAASGPSRRRWWSLNAASTRRSNGSAGRQADAPDHGQREEHRHRARDAHAEHPVQLVGRQDVEQRRRDDEIRVLEITRRQPGEVGAPCLDGDRGTGGAATASSSRSSSRSWTTQCCGAGSRGASQRPIAPLPPPRSWISRGPVAGRCPARRPASSALRAAASAGSRRASHPGLTRTTAALIASLPTRTWARTDVVAAHPRSEARRSRAARRRRLRSSASPSQ